jgi:hypothetical protein
VGTIVGFYVDLVNRRVGFSVDGQRIESTGYDLYPLRLSVREQIHRLKKDIATLSVSEIEPSGSDINRYYLLPIYNTVLFSFSLGDAGETLGEYTDPAKEIRKAVAAEIARLQKILDTDPLGNPADPEEAWWIYSMLDWGGDIVRLEEIYHGGLAEKIFMALPLHPFKSTHLERADNDDDVVIPFNWISDD